MRRAGRTIVAATALSLATLGCDRAVPEQPNEAEPIAVARLDPYRAPVRTEVRPGDTIESVCRRLAGADWVQWRDALATELDPRRLAPGIAFEGTRSTSGQLEALQVVLDRRSRLQLEAHGGEISCDRVELPVSSTVERLEGEITTSLFAAVAEAGGDPELAVRLAEVFQWDVDFFRDLRGGDRFVAIVDRQSIDGAFVGYGTLFAARFVNDRRILEAVVYPDASGRLGYYDLEGRPLRKQFLRSPLKFGRITSRFSMSRFHPILKRRTPHYGVDYGAPIGTPVVATGDGKVTLVGRQEGAGRLVRIRHPNGYETHYLHLSRYGPGISNGVRVTQGQVIGFVGSSGWSTGPHLDYRVTQNGRWINPLGISSPPAEPLAPDRMQRFLSHAVAVLELLEGGGPPSGARC